jgi:hypothetical protein
MSQGIHGKGPEKLPQRARAASVPPVSIAATFAVAALAAAALRRLRPAGLPPLEGVVLGLGCALALASSLSFLLSLTDRLSARNFSLLGFALVAALLLLPPIKAAKIKAPRLKRGLLEFVAIATLLLIGLGLRAPVMENPLGGRDAGSYTLRTQHTLRSGRFEFEDEILASAAAEYQQAPRAGLEDLLGAYPIEREGLRVDRYEAPYRPGFYLADREAGRVIPQFFHFYPSTLAVGGLILGPEELHRFSTVIAALFLLTWTCICLRIFESATARLVAIGLLCICPLAIWTDRQTLSETSYGLWLALALLACIARTQDDGDEPATRLRFGYLAGGFLACATVTRGDAWVWAPFVLAALWWRDRDATGHGARLFALLFAIGAAVHAHHAFPYLHDELLRRWPGGKTPTPGALTVLTGVGLLAWWINDLGLGGAQARRAKADEDSSRHALRRGRALLILLALMLAGYALFIRGASAAPFSRLDPVVGSLGWPWLVLALLGLALLYYEGSEQIGRYFAFSLIALLTMALFVPRQLPSAGLYYYGRYLTPLVLPLCALLAGLVFERATRLVPEGAPRAVGVSLGLGLLVHLAWPLMSSAQTHMEEREGASEAVELISARLRPGAIVIAGGEGWHRGFTFNQIAGALAMREGVRVLPYRDRQRAYHMAYELLVASPASSGKEPPPVYLLINESTHHYTRKDDKRVVAGSDDLLSAPLQAKRVHNFEFWFDRLTPDPDAPPTRITRDGMRMSLIELDISAPQLEREGVELRLVSPKVRRAGPVTNRSASKAQNWKEGKLCLDPQRPLSFHIDSSKITREGGELIVEMHPGSAANNAALNLEIDGQRVPLDSPGSSPQPRGTLGPFPLTPGQHRIAIRAFDTTVAGPCPHGSLAALRLLPPPRSALSSLEATNRDASTLHRGSERGHPVKRSAWASSVSLTRFRVGLPLETEIAGMSMRLRAGRSLDFPTSWLPREAVDEEEREFDVIVTLSKMKLSEGVKLALELDGEGVQLSSPPLQQAGSWQSPKLRWTGHEGRVRARLLLVGANAANGDFVDVRDIAFFSREPLTPSEAARPLP